MELVEVEKLRISRSQDTTSFATQSVGFRLGEWSPSLHNRLLHSIFLFNPITHGQLHSQRPYHSVQTGWMLLLTAFNSAIG